MQISLETTQGLERRMTVAVEEDRIANAVESRLKDMTRTVKLKGFRKGKVPLKVVQQYYGTQVRQEVMGEVLQSSFYEAVTQEKLRPAGMPNFDTKEQAPGTGLEYTVVFEVYPDVKVASLENETIEIPVTEITEIDVDNMIETIRKQHLEWEAVDRASVEGDRIKIDFKGTVDGETFVGGEGEDVPVELGQGRMIKGFEEGLMGKKVGDEVTLDLVFPDEYHAKELAGKPVQFAVRVKSVEVCVLPEVNEAFATKLGVEDGDLGTLRSDIRDNMQRELDTRISSKLKDAIMEKLLKTNVLEVPDALIENESRALLNQMTQNLVNQGITQNDLSTLNLDMFKEQAERRVTLGLIMSEIVKENDLKVEATKVRAKVEEIAQSYEHPEEVVKWYYGDKQRMAEIESLVFEESVVDWVKNQVKISEKTVSVDELMKPETGK